MPDFLPRPNGKLLAWSANFRERISVDPGALSLTQEQVAAYAVAQDAFAEVMARADSPGTRTQVVVLEMNLRKAEMVDIIRHLARIIRATASVTADQRVLLGLAPQRQRVRHISPPSTPPYLQIVRRTCEQVYLRLIDPLSPTRKSRPAGVASATVLMYVGKSRPKKQKDWGFACNTTQTRLTIDFPTDAPAGSKQFLTAFWSNRRSEPSRYSNTADIEIPYTLAEAA